MERPAGLFEGIQVMSETTINEPMPWWHGTVLPTGQYRLKEAPNGRVYLQQLVRDPSSMKRRWIRCPRVGAEVPDDE